MEVRVLILALTLVSVKSQDTGEERKMEFELIEHRPCTKKGRSSRADTITFPDSTKSPIQPVYDKPGCYRLRGMVKVKRDVRYKLQMYLEVRNEEEAPPQPCQNSSADACGGFGSCLFCDACKFLTEAIGDNVDIKLRGMDRRRKKWGAIQTDLTCNQGFRRGEHKYVNLEFCFPTKKEFFNAMGFENFDNGGLLQQTTIYLKVFIFNTRINLLLMKQRELEASIRAANQMSETEAIDPKYLRNLRFTRMLNNQRNVIGCHYIVGNIHF